MKKQQPPKIREPDYELELLHTIASKRFAYDYASVVIDKLGEKFWLDKRKFEIYKLIKSIVSDGYEPNIVAMFVYARKNNLLAKCGGSEYLASVWTETSFGDVEILTSYLSELAIHRNFNRINLTKIG